MARIAGVNIPTSKRVPIALTYITGIGHASAKAICEAVNIDPSRRVNELSDAEALALREHIDANYTVEGDLRRERSLNLKRLQNIKSYRGLRHARGHGLHARRIIVPAQGDVAVAIAWGGKTENEREHQSRSAQGGRQRTRVQQL